MFRLEHRLKLPTCFSQVKYKPLSKRHQETMIAQTQLTEFSRDSKMVDDSTQMICFVFTTFELKNINFNASFLGFNDRRSSQIR